MKKRCILLAVNVVLFFVLACNIGAQSPAVSGVVQTLTPLSPNATPGNETAAAGIATNKPVVRVYYSTDCRTGPDSVYDLVATLPKDYEAEPIGKNLQSTNSYTFLYLLVVLPTGERCWLDSQDVLMEVDVDSLPEIPPPPTPTPRPPAAPQDLIANETCSTITASGSPVSDHYSLQLSWNDVADNETSYIVEYGGTSKSFPANTTSANIEADTPPGSGLQVRVIAKNDGGQASSDTRTFTCP